MNRDNRQIRANSTQFEVREEENDLFIEGYFAVFNSDYEMWDGASESIAPGAFSNTLSNDVRALVDHDTRLVLGRTKNHTLELREDSYGLWGRVKINRDDSDAMNLYNRVKRGDVDQCSFGFQILGEDVDYREDGSVHWTIREVELYEVSVVTFPAYKDTAVSARKRDFEAIRQRKTEKWRTDMMKKLKEGA